MTPEQLFDAALANVESASIRAWAQSDHNRPIWVQIAQKAIDNNPKLSDEERALRLTTFIVCQAIGL